MKQNTTTYIRDIVWDVKIDNPMGSEIKRQVKNIMTGVAEPVFSSKGKAGISVIVGSSDINTTGLGPDDHIIKTINYNVHIAGGTDRAAAYGVFSFLEEIGFYFLASKTIKPSHDSGIQIPVFDKTYKTKNNWRGMFLSLCMVSTSIMSLSDYQNLIDNMLRMKMNRLIFYSFENEPIIDYTFRGERKLVGDISRPESGFMSYGRNWTGSFFTDEIKIGREKFNRKKVAPMEFQEVNSSEEALDKGKEFMRAIIRMAGQRGIGVWISFLPQFVSMNMSKHIKPMPRKNLHWSALVSCTDDTVREINSARIKNIMESYPELEGLFIGIPEGFYEDPYPESDDYIDREFPNYKTALELQKIYWGDHWPGKELQEKHIRADIGFSKIAIDSIEDARRLYPELKLGLITVCKAYLLTKLHRELPKNITFCDIESRSLWTHGGAPLFLFKEMMGRECTIIPRITDDGSQAGMQFNLKLYHMDGYCKSADENSTSGLIMQTLHIKGADHNIKYLAEGLWNTDIHPNSFYESYFENVYGKKSKSLMKAYEILEDNEILMGGRGASNMPWNHVPLEIAVMRNLQANDNPWHSCPFSCDYIENANARVTIYKKTVGYLNDAEALFKAAAEEGADRDECIYMALRTKGYSKHLSALIELVGMYTDYYNMFKKNLLPEDINKLVSRVKTAKKLAIESAGCFSDCVSHVTDLAVLWMINSSMVTGTKVLYNYMKNIYRFYIGEEYWHNPGWKKLFGECPYPAHGLNILKNDDTMYEPG